MHKHSGLIFIFLKNIEIGLGGISEIIAGLADQSDFHISCKDIILEVIQSCCFFLKSKQKCMFTIYI